ncbi:hypothetical protein BDK63_003580 [Halomonas campaniensis]|uniref:Uncharacterized protein n=1 Tax=Halomonas campaniensis TaxID=213554 RepID=A0A7W5K6E5_9GAMM|nr:hypothetical protein [Halomonas campaniensis]MBB3332680.1 hypothetical protein [Halomonas campaniensis]
MSTERPKAYYTAVFLQVSFRAIKDSMAGKAGDGLPCWLDTRMLGMLCRDLQACCIETDDQDPAHRPLADARDACDQLLARCPGGLDSTLCHHHLDAILEALGQAITALDRPPSPPDASRWQTASRYLLQGFRRLT